MDKNNIINFDLKEAENHNKMVKYNYKSGFNKLGNLLFEKILYFIFVKIINE